MTRRQPSPAARLDGALAQLAAVKRAPAAPPTTAAPVAAKAPSAFDPATIADLAASKSPAELTTLGASAFGRRDARSAAALWMLAARRGDIGGALHAAMLLVDGSEAAGLRRDDVVAEGLLRHVIAAAAAAAKAPRVQRDNARSTSGPPSTSTAGRPLQLEGDAGDWARFALASLLIRRQVEAAAGDAGASGSLSHSAPAPSSPSTSTPPAVEHPTPSSDAQEDAAPRLQLSAVRMDAIPLDRRASAPLVEARQLLEAAAVAGGVPPAWLNLANCLQLGIGSGVVDAAGARLWTAHAAARGDPRALEQLAAQYSASAASQAAAEASAAAAVDPGAATTAAEGSIPLDKASPSREGIDPTAHALWRAAAEAGSPQAMHNVGVAYLKGAGPPPEIPSPTSRDSVDATFAAALAAAAATPRRPPVPPDAAAALVWFERAAQAGYVRSAVNAAALLETAAADATTSATDREARLRRALHWYTVAEMNLRRQPARGRAVAAAAASEGGDVELTEADLVDIQTRRASVIRQLAPREGNGVVQSA